MTYEIKYNTNNRFPKPLTINEMNIFTKSTK
jgi:hypothetical protein